MKDHLTVGQYACIMCGLSGRKPQSKGVISGLPLEMFLRSTEACTLCQKKLMDIVNRKRVAKGKQSITFDQYKERKLKALAN